MVYKFVAKSVASQVDRKLARKLASSYKSPAHSPSVRSDGREIVFDLTPSYFAHLEALAIIATR